MLISPHLPYIPERAERILGPYRTDRPKEKGEGLADKRDQGEKRGIRMNYVVIDLEMCNVPYCKTNRDYRWRMETIQIGAVLVDRNFEIVDKFSTYVKPQAGSISDFIKRLTGITAYHVKEAPTFEEAMSDFISWLPTDEDIRFVSWSMTDRKQIIEEAANKNIDLSGLDEIFETWIDAQDLFGEKMDTIQCYRLSEALIASDIYQEGDSHDGLDDAFNTAKLFIKMETEPDFTLNETYRSAKEDGIEHLSFNVGSLFATLQVG